METQRTLDFYAAQIANVFNILEIKELANLVPRFEWSSFCEEERRTKERERKAD